MVKMEKKKECENLKNENDIVERIGDLKKLLKEYQKKHGGEPSDPLTWYLEGAIKALEWALEE